MSENGFRIVNKQKGGLIRRLADNALFMTGFEMVVRYGLGIIVLPIALVKFESVELAYYLFISTIVALAFLADSGFSQTILRAASYFRAGAVAIPERISNLSANVAESSPNWPALGRLISTSQRIYGVIGIAAAVLLSTLGAATAFNVINKQHNHLSAWFAYFFLVLVSIVLLQVSRWTALLQGLDQVARAKRIEFVCGIARLLGIAAAILLGTGVLGVVIVMLAISLASMLMMKSAVLNALRLNGLTKHDLKQYDHAMFRQLWPSTWRMAGICWGGYLIYYGTSIIISQFPDANMIASYLLTFQVVTLLYRLSTSPAIAYQPQMAAAMSSGDLAMVNFLSIKILRLAFAIYIGFGVIAYFFAADVLSLIGSKTHLVAANIFIMMLAMYLLEMHHSIHAGIYLNSNHVPFLVPALVSGTAIVFLGFIFLKSFGIYAVIWAQFLVQAAFNNWYPVFLSLRLQKMPFKTYMRSFIRIDSHP